MISYYEWKFLKEETSDPIDQNKQQIDPIDEIEDEQNDPNPQDPLKSSKIGNTAKILLTRLIKLINKRPSFFAQKQRAYEILQPLNNALYQASQNISRSTAVNRQLRTDLQHQNQQQF